MRWLFAGLVVALSLVGAVAAVAVTVAFGGSGAGTLTTTTSPGSVPVSGRCSRATARQLVEQHRLNGFDLPDPVAQLLCGPFTGPGSQAMVIAIGILPTCWPVQRWVVFSFTGGAWRLVLDTPAYLIPPLVAVGSDIRETTAVHRPGDSRCIPSGGTHARIWHWNGTRLVAGPWKQVTPGTTRPGVGAHGNFKTPSGNIVCEYFFNYPGRRGERPYNFLRCGIHSGLKPAPPSRGPRCQQFPFVSIRATGRSSPLRSVCPGEDAPDIGPFAGERAARVLAYGKTWSGGGLGCTSAVTGLTCRNKSGHGFFLSRERWRSF